MLVSGGATRAALLFAWVGAALFLVALLYFLYAYLVRFGAADAAGSAVGALALDIALFTVFALHHSVLARDAVKARVRLVVPPPLERSVYTWLASLLFLAVCAGWRPLPGALYHLNGAAALAAHSLQLLGIFIAWRSSARLQVLDLAGVRQVLDARRGQLAAPVPLQTTGLYGLVRHPVYLGWVLFVFAAPHMTMTRAAFAAISTLYLVIAVFYEERSLVASFGSGYRTYQSRVRYRIVPGVF